MLETLQGGMLQGMSLMLLSANTEYHNLIGNTALTTAAQVEKSSKKQKTKFEQAMQTSWQKI